MSKYTYYFVKNTPSYDRAVALLKFLQNEAQPIFKDAVLRFLSENYYIKLDHKILNKENIDIAREECLFETKKSFYNFQENLFPNVRATIIFEKNYFYYLFENMSYYEGEEFLNANKIAPLQLLRSPLEAEVKEFYQRFYLETVFFNSSRIEINEQELEKYKPAIDFRAQEQIKIILTEQLMQKNYKVSHTEVMKINQTVRESKNSNLMQKVKAAIIKAEQVLGGGKANKM